jgi:hypothetical protein
MRSVRVVATTAAAAAGLFSLVLLGSPLSELVWPGLGFCVAAPLLRVAVPARLPWAAFTLVVMVALGIWVVRGGEATQAVGLALVWLQVQRCLGRSGPGDDRAVLLQSALMLVLAATRTRDPLFLPTVMVWAVMVPVVLVGSEGERQTARWIGRPREVTGALWVAPAALFLAVLVFLGTPRLRGADLGSGSDTGFTGFDDNIELGDVGQLLDDDEVVFTATFDGTRPDELTYFRGVALDDFDGRRWRAGSLRHPPPSREHSPLGVDVHVVLEPVEDGVLFTVGDVVAVDVDRGSVVADSDGNRFVHPALDRVDYRFVAVPPFGTGAGPPARGATTGDLIRWTRLPQTLDPRVRELASQVAGELVDPMDKAAALRRLMLEDFEYTRAPRDTDVEDPLATFLFERRSGHCEYFASALAMMLRSEGVPTRLVNGFVGGDPGPVGDVIVVRRHHAHSWVELLVDGRWVVLDATPGPGAPVLPARERWSDALSALWYSSVLDYDLDVQAGAVWDAGWQLESVVTGAAVQATAGDRPWVGVVVLAALLGAAAVAAGRQLGLMARRLAGERATERQGRVARVHHRAQRLLARRGWRVPPSLPPVDAAEWLILRAGEPADCMADLAWLHYRVRYGGEADDDLVAEARELLARVRQIPPPVQIDAPARADH